MSYRARLRTSRIQVRSGTPPAAARQAASSSGLVRTVIVRSGFRSASGSRGRPRPFFDFFFCDTVNSLDPRGLTDVLYSVSRLIQVYHKERDMTAKAINGKLEIETAIHQAALQAVELIAQAKKRVKELGGDEDEAEQRMLELITEDD